jgi:hypothetical protein
MAIFLYAMYATPKVKDQASLLSFSRHSSCGSGVCGRLVLRQGTPRISPFTDNTEIKNQKEMIREKTTAFGVAWQTPALLYNVCL